MTTSKKLIIDTGSERLVLRSEKEMEFQINGDFIEVFERSANSLFRSAVFYKPIMVKYGEKE
jgi:hypothetical protein